MADHGVTRVDFTTAGARLSVGELLERLSLLDAFDVLGAAWAAAGDHRAATLMGAIDRWRSETTLVRLPVFARVHDDALLRAQARPGFDERWQQIADGVGRDRPPLPQLTGPGQPRAR